MKQRILALTLIGLAACAEPALDIQSAPLSAEVKRSVQNERIGAYTRHAVRTYTVDPATGAQTEIAGAVCTLQSAELTLRVISPATVDLPSFVQRERFPNRGKPDNLTVTCRSDGIAGAQAIEADTTRRSGSRTTTDPAYISSPIGGGQAGSNPWGYPATLKVTLQ